MSVMMKLLHEIGDRDLRENQMLDARQCALYQKFVRDEFPSGSFFQNLVKALCGGYILGILDPPSTILNIADAKAEFCLLVKSHLTIIQGSSVRVAQLSQNPGKR